MLQSETPVLLVKGNYHFACSVITGGRRLVEILNDQYTSFLKTANITVLKSAVPAKKSLSDGLLLKSQLEVAIILSQDHEAAERRFYARVEKGARSAVVTLPSVLISGKVHLQGRGDAASFLAVEAGQFFPITDATVYHLTNSTESLTVPVALVNRDHVVHFSLDSDLEENHALEVVEEELVR